MFLAKQYTSQPFALSLSKGREPFDVKDSVSKKPHEYDILHIVLFKRFFDIFNFLTLRQAQGERGVVPNGTRLT